jgi:hypothetical protein
MATQEMSWQWVPEACTLPTAQQPLRVAEFDDLFAGALRSVERLTPTAVRLWLAASAEATARDLAAREAECCSFFTFTFEPPGDGAMAMTVSVPSGHDTVLDALAARAATTSGVSP